MRCLNMPLQNCQMTRALPCPVAQQHVAPRKVASVAGAAVGAGEAVGQAGAGH